MKRDSALARELCGCPCRQMLDVDFLPGGQHDRMQRCRYVDSCDNHVRSGVRARVVEDRDEGVKDSAVNRYAANCFVL